MGWPKTRALGSFQTPRDHHHRVGQRLRRTTAPHLAPIAPRLLVGVDHIPSRWAAQRAAARLGLCRGQLT